MTTKVPAPLQSLLKTLIHEALPEALDAAGLAPDAASLRPCPLDWSAEAGLRRILESLPKNTSPSILNAFHSAISAVDRTGTDDTAAAAWHARAGLESLNGVLVREALALHPERGGLARVAVLLEKEKSSISRVAAGSGIALGEVKRQILRAHLRDPEGHPLPVTPKPGPVPWSPADETKRGLGNTAKLHLTAAEVERVGHLANQHPGGISIWIADAIRAYVRGGVPVGELASAPVDAKPCAWLTDPAALVRLDKAIGTSSRALHLRVAVLRHLTKKKVPEKKR